jgi:hypothetical protein
MRFLPALTVAVLLTMAAAPLAAQVDAGTCQLIDSRLVERRVQDGVATLYVTGPALARCAGDVEIRADSAVLLEATAEIRLFRNVLFRDPFRQLTSDRATYFDGPGRLHAVGNVEFVDRERGSTLTGPELDYFRETEARPEPRVVAIGRPRLVLVPETAPGAEPEEPFTVDADRMVVEGDDRLTASGRVEIARSDFDGSGREAFYDGGREFLELRGDARIAGEAFDLAAERIEARLPDGGIEQVLALRQARLEGEELTVTGDRIDLRFAEDELQRMIARGLPAGEDEAGELAVAIAEEFRMEADSLDAELPGQQLERVVAVGRARGESLAGFGGQRPGPCRRAWDRDRGPGERRRHRPGLDHRGHHHRLLRARGRSAPRGPRLRPLPTSRFPISRLSWNWSWRRRPPRQLPSSRLVTMPRSGWSCVAWCRREMRGRSSAARTTTRIPTAPR